MWSNFVVCYRISISSEKHLSEDKQQEQDLLDIRCLQVLRALIHNQIKMIDPEQEDRNPKEYRRCKCLTNAWIVQAM